GSMPRPRTRTVCEEPSGGASYPLDPGWRCSMGNAETQDFGPPNTSGDLWKFFEERGAAQEESRFKFVTWIGGFAAVILGFAVKEAFEKGLEKIAHPFMLFILGCVGLALIIHAFFLVREHGQHINRTFNRANAARDGVSAPKKIWDAGEEAKDDSLPSICWQLLYVLSAFGLVFVVFASLGLGAWLSKVL